MALTDLLKSFVRGVTLTTALYSCGGEGSERIGCRDDRDCTKGRVCEYEQESGERYCVGKNGEDTSNQTENGDSIYGTWMPVKINSKKIKEYNRTSEGAMMFERCQDGTDRWHTLEGLRANGRCNYGDGGTFEYGIDDLLLSAEGKPTTFLSYTLKENHLVIIHPGSSVQPGYINPGDRWAFLRVDSSSVLPCLSPCRR